MKYKIDEKCINFLKKSLIAKAKKYENLFKVYLL